MHGGDENACRIAWISFICVFAQSASSDCLRNRGGCLCACLHFVFTKLILIKMVLDVAYVKRC
jgi:hypothetical protein